MVAENTNRIPKTERDQVFWLNNGLWKGKDGAKIRNREVYHFHAFAHSTDFEISTSGRNLGEFAAHAWF